MLGNNKKNIGFDSKIFKSGGVSFQGILDLYPNANARGYSVYKQLKASATRAFIQRSAGGGTIDATFLNNLVNQSLLTTFLGANNGFISTIYDQNGSGKNATQATSTKQSRNANAGVLKTESGGLVTEFIAANLCEYYKTSDSLNDFTFYCRLKVTSGNLSFNNSDGNNPQAYGHSSGSGTGFRTTGYVPLGTDINSYGYTVIAMRRQGANGSMYINGALTGSTSALGTGAISQNKIIGAFFGTYPNAVFQTMLIYPTYDSPATIAAISALL